MRNPGEQTDLVDNNDVMVARLNVQDRDSIGKAIEAGIARVGTIDTLIDDRLRPVRVFEATSREKIREQFDVNVFGVMDVTRAILPHFRKNKGGLIINVSCRYGIFTLPMLSLYCASKFALEGFSESLSYELASQKIVVKIVEPGRGGQHQLRET